MPKRIPPLTDLQVNNAKPKAKPYKLADGGGLFLLVTPIGGKWWRFKYRFGGKEKLLSFGTYPDVPLQAARKRRDEAREKVAAGIDPGEERRAEKTAEKAQVAEEKKKEQNTFKKVALEWHREFLDTWSSRHAATLEYRLEKDVFPWIGNAPIGEIKASHLLEVLQRIKSRGALDQAHRVRHTCSQIFRYAIASGLADGNPAEELRGYLPPVKNKHFAAPTEPKAVVPLLRAIDEYQGSFVVKCALRLAPLVFTRPGELRNAEWVEFDFENAQWNIPAGRMKMKEPHIVPLSKQAIAILQDIKPLTGDGKYVFPCQRTPHRCMSDNAMNAALRRMGFEKSEITSHGFRAMARTILDEELQVRPDFIEHQLAHAVKDTNGRAYNRTTHLAERRKMMQQWADYLDGLKHGAKVIPLHRVA